MKDSYKLYRLLDLESSYLFQDVRPIFKALFSYIRSDIKGVDFHEKRHFYTLIFLLWGNIHPPKRHPN